MGEGIVGDTKRPSRRWAFSFFLPPTHFPHIGNGEFFEGDEVVGVEGGGHGGERILYLGVIAKEKALPPKR